VTRKLAAIVAADVVGYSRLMGADEAATLAEQERHLVLRAPERAVRPAIAEDQAHIVKTTGAGLLVDFRSGAECDGRARR
jgi:class 3 adenylate cyclase